MTIEQRRKKMHMSRKELAERTGLALITIGRYERGERKPTADALIKLAVTFGCSVDDLLKEYQQ